MSKDEKGDVPKSDRMTDPVTSKWLTRNIGREVEFYLQRAPKVQGVLRAVDERFGRVIIETDTEEVIVWMSGITEIRMQRKDNGSREK